MWTVVLFVYLCAVFKNLVSDQSARKKMTETKDSKHIES